MTQIGAQLKIKMRKAAGAAGAATVAGCCNECGDGWGVTVDEATQSAQDVFQLQNATDDPIAIRVEFLGTLCAGACIEWEVRSLLNATPVLSEIVLTPDGCGAVDIAIEHSDVDLWGNVWFGLYATIDGEPICQTLLFSTQNVALCFADVDQQIAVCFDPYTGATWPITLTLAPGYEATVPGDLVWVFLGGYSGLPDVSLNTYLSIAADGGAVVDGFMLTKTAADMTDQPFYVDVTIASADSCNSSALFTPNDRIIATTINSGAASDTGSGGYFSPAGFGTTYPQGLDVATSVPWSITLQWSPRCDNSGGAALASWAYNATWAGGAFDRSLEVTFTELGDQLQIDAVIPDEGDQSNLLDSLFVIATDVDGNSIPYSFALV